MTKLVRLLPGWFWSPRLLRRRRPGRPAVSQRQRAKAAVLIGLAALLLFQFGMNVALDTVKPEWRDPEFGHRLKRLRQLQADQPQRPLVLALGSSRPQMGLNPSEVGYADGPTDPLVFNFCQAGCGPLQQYLNLQRLLDAGVKPDYLLVEVLSPVLAGNSRAEELLIPQRLSLADLGRIRHLCEESDQLAQEWAGYRIAPWYSLRQYLMSHWLGSWLPWQHRQDFLWKQMHDNGWIPYFYERLEPADRDQKFAEAAAQYAGYFADFRIAELQDRSLRELLKTCQRHEIPVAIFVMPEGPRFRGLYPSGSRELVNDYLNRLAKEFGAELFDAHDWLDDDRFADSHHLMKHGANEFSRRFGDTFLRPWLETRTKSESATFRNPSRAARY